MDIQVNPDHPLALELKSLRGAVATFQRESHEASVKLQKYSLETSRSYERTQALESENARLKDEIAVLRASPDISPHPDSLQIQELTLAHRRLSDQLAITEASLSLRTSELTEAQSELAKAKQDAQGAFELASRIRGREEEGLLRERELERKVKAAEEERRMAELVVSEYADLVRSLEGRRSIAPPPVPPKSPNLSEDVIVNGSSSTPTLANSYAEGKKGLQKLLGEFSVESERLEAKIAKLESELAIVETKWESERKIAELDRKLLATVQAELVKIRMDDKIAAKMVSRYMEFSQYSTDTLQKAMDNLKTRHAATVSSLSLEIEHLQISLASDRRQTKKLKAALNDLSEDISRETYGRRREVSLRLALLLRESAVAEGLQRWSRKARELFNHSAKAKESTQTSFEKCVEGAESLLQTLNGDKSLHSDASGSVARILAAQDAVAALAQELQVETGKRMELEREKAQGLFLEPPLPPPKVAEPAVLDQQADPDLNSTEAIPIPSTPLSPPPVTSSSDPHPLPPTGETSANDVPKVVVASAEAPHAVSRGLLARNFATDNVEPMTEKSVTPAFKPHVEENPHSNELNTKVIVTPLDVLHQPTPRSRQEASFIAPAQISPSEPSSRFPQSLTFSNSPSRQNAPDEANVLTKGVPHQITSGYTITPRRMLFEHPLLTSLEQVRHRYDYLQRAFRDCQLTLENLKKDVASISPVTETVVILQSAIQRLDDFNEDARVEVEIRITDEELITRGYQTLLAVPGAISDDTEQVNVEVRIKAFVDGTVQTIAKATEQLTRKLDDLQHDIATVKRALHNLPEPDLQRSSTPHTPANWSSWTHILGGSRPVSPAPPTFGSVMTSPRLQHSPSQLYSGRRSSIEPAPASAHSRPDPFESLGLRIPMPSHVAISPIGVGRSPSTPNSRPRNVSAMYMLGLGSRSTSLGITTPQSANFTPVKSASLARYSHIEGSVTAGTTDELQTSDVE